MKYETKFKIDDKVMTPISDCAATVVSISLRRRERGYYTNDTAIYTFYMVNVPLRELGKPSYTSVTVEYEESSLTSLK